MGYEVAAKALVLGLVLGAVAGIRPSKLVREVPAMYVFGDSTLDVGNNNYLTGEGVPRAEKPYYGIDLPAKASPGPTSPTTASTCRAPASPPEGSATATTSPISSVRTSCDLVPAYIAM